MRTVRRLTARESALLKAIGLYVLIGLVVAILVDRFPPVPGPVESRLLALSLYVIVWPLIAAGYIVLLILWLWTRLFGG